MALRFYNTLTQRVEDFAPLHDNEVRMYTCGPTVYNYAHIGNLRTFTFEDILRRWLAARIFRNSTQEHLLLRHLNEHVLSALRETAQTQSVRRFSRGEAARRTGCQALYRFQSICALLRDNASQNV